MNIKMKKSTLFLAGLAFSAAAATHATGAPRLALWVTDSIGTGNGEKCNLAPDSLLPATAPTLTEDDVTAWHRQNARWTLNVERFPADGAGQKLQDHCFVLAIDGTMVSSGIVLSSYSARLTGFPTISLYNQNNQNNQTSQNSQNNALYLQLTSGNHGSHSKMIHVAALDAVLAQPANLTRQLQKLRPTDEPKHLQIMGYAWASAVQKLIDQKKIQQGMSLKELIKLLGQPTTYPRGYSGPHSWRFETSQQVLSSFHVDVKDGVVRAYRLERK